MTHTDHRSARQRPPLAVWSCGPDDGTAVTERLAEHLVHEYTSRGHTIADLTGTGKVAHHAEQVGRASEVDASTSCEFAEPNVRAVAWADLTVTALPAQDEPRRARGRRARAQVIFASMITRPGGVIAAITPVGHAPDGALIDPAPGLVRAATRAGLVYMQHVIALTTPICGSGLGAAVPVRTHDDEWNSEADVGKLPVTVAEAAATITSPAHLNVSVFRVPEKDPDPVNESTGEVAA